MISTYLEIGNIISVSIWTEAVFVKLPKHNNKQSERAYNNV